MRTLADYLCGRPLHPAIVVECGIGVADALRHIHRDYVYGCLTPTSILLTDHGVELAPPLRIAGISPYAAPEQLLGRYDDPRSDIFALGTILYEMATGRRAFECRDVEELRAAILECDPEPVHAAPARLARIVSTCLEKRPERRFQRAQLLAAQLKLMGASLRISAAAMETEFEPGPAEAGLPTNPVVAAATVYALPEAATGAEPVLFTPDEEAVGRRQKKTQKPCPKCRSADVRPSRPKGAWEDALAEVGVKFRRCYRCYHRFMQIAFVAVSLDG